jgi:integrase
MDLYLEGRPNLKPRSREAYRDAVERHFASWLDIPLRNINREMVESRHRAIAQEVSERQPHSGHAAANGAMRALRAIWNFTADRNDDLGRNPVRLKGQWHKIHPRERHLREDDLPKFYEAVRELPSAIGRDYVLVLLFTGLRRREATNLRWGDVDLQAKKIRIPSIKTKSGRALDLPMTDVVHDLLVARRSLGKTEFVFTAHSASGHLEEPRFFLDQVAAKTCIRVSAHDLRRTYLTIAESCDISPIALRALVNHSLGKDVTSGYIQMNAQRLREPAQRVTDKIKKLCGIAESESDKVAKLQNEKKGNKR